MIKNKDTIYSSIFVLIVLQYIFIRFNGSFHSLFMYNLKFYAYNLFENDFYLKNSLSLKTSILYPILKFSKINFDNDYVGFFIHLIFSVFTSEIFSSTCSIRRFKNVKAVKIRDIKDTNLLSFLDLT